ncbi:hypothetical protein Salat_1138400 [Sesamum alatum]|uniref:Uncharacterized protein n=1 Tax=Sesamum alatum TaxID=300844 RepID=A0AAE2CN76_9LAMI|nr:hypothetical protein Salat_1138400 [Sesamum alatum]
MGYCSARTPDIASFIGNQIGKFIEVDTEDKYVIWSSSLRIRVALDVNKPLAVFCDLQFQDGFVNPGDNSSFGPWLRAPPPFASRNKSTPPSYPYLRPLKTPSLSPSSQRRGADIFAPSPSSTSYTTPSRTSPTPRPTSSHTPARTEQRESKIVRRLRTKDCSRHRRRAERIKDCSPVENQSLFVPPPKSRENQRLFGGGEPNIVCGAAEEQRESKIELYPHGELTIVFSCHFGSRWCLFEGLSGSSQLYPEDYATFGSLLLAITVPPYVKVNFDATLFLPSPDIGIIILARDHAGNFHT